MGQGEGQTRGWGLWMKLSRGKVGGMTICPTNKKKQTIRKFCGGLYITDHFPATHPSFYRSLASNLPPTGPEESRGATNDPIFPIKVLGIYKWPHDPSPLVTLLNNLHTNRRSYFMEEKYPPPNVWHNNIFTYYYTRINYKMFKSRKIMNDSGDTEMGKLMSPSPCSFAPS